MTSLTLSDEQLKRLTPEDLNAYYELLEKAYWAKGKESFLDFCTRVDVPGAPLNDDDTEHYPITIEPADHHKLIIKGIQRLSDDRENPEKEGIDGFCVFMPPGSAKSTYLSVLAPAWLLGRRPGTNVIAASYGQDLANRFGRRVRTIVRSSAYEDITGATITGDNQAVDNWSVTNGSDYRAAGFGAAVTGFRADYLLVDDPVKSREDADSEIIRDKTWRAFDDDLSTRLKPGGKIFLAMTRWHEDDLAGRLLGEGWKGQSGLWRGTDGRLWMVLNLPLLAEHKDDPLNRPHGGLLWPEWFTMKEAQRLQKLGKKGGTWGRTWSSLYQQRPAPDEGAILMRGYWREWKKEDLPDIDRVYLTYDTAFEEGEDADYSAMTAWGTFQSTSKKADGSEYKHDHVIMIGAWKDRVSAVDLIKVVEGHAKMFKPDRILIEKRASGIQLIQELKRRRWPVKEWLPRGKPGAKGKVPRAHAVAAILESRSVWYYPGAKTEAVIDECAAFPHGKNDDWVDTVTMSLSFFRDHWIFQTAADELDEDELKESLLDDSNRRRSRRSLYGGPAAGTERAINHADIERMTPETRRRLYD